MAGLAGVAGDKDSISRISPGRLWCAVLVECSGSAAALTYSPHHFHYQIVRPYRRSRAV